MKADIWAVGICLYRCIAGVFPFRGVNENDLYTKIKNGHFDKLSFIPEPLHDLFTLMLIVDAEKRVNQKSVIGFCFI